MGGLIMSHNNSVDRRGAKEEFLNLAAITEIELEYMVGLVSRYARCVADEFAISTDAVDSDTGLGGPGYSWCQRK